MPIHGTRLLLVAAAALVVSLSAQPRSEYRAFWVDTFNTTLSNHADVLAVVNNAKAANANAIFAQVRRRGDSFYLNSLEPPADRTAIQPGFDPLLDLVNTAHAEGIEVHAFVIMAAVWGRSPLLFPPENANHVFNKHGGYDAASNTIITGPNNWLTRTLLPDGSGITYQGHRFGNDFWVDFGHPEAAAYTVDVLMHLVKNYDIDGLHLDRIRYPEFTAAGQTPTNGTNIGYNPISIARFQKHYGIPAGSPPPAQNDPQWNQWRRDQVTNIVRRVYLNALSVKPALKVSAALIAFGGGPTTEGAWTSAEAYWRVYQDWRAWTEEGILDMAIPMNYKREHTASNVPMLDTWNEWTKNHAYNRSTLIGLGPFINSVEGSLRQTRKALAPSAAGNSSKGVVYFSMATSNIAVAANPLSIPPGQNTPLRSFADFAAGLRTGRSADGTVLFEDPATNPVPIFEAPATLPLLAWKTAPTVGHLMGFALQDTTPLDTAAVTVARIPSGPNRSTTTDGGGFYGAVDLAPGQYLVSADGLYSCVITVTAGQVFRADLKPDSLAPQTTLAIAPPANAAGWHNSDVTATLSASDTCTGIGRSEYSTNSGTTWIPYGAPVTFSTEGTTVLTYRSVDRAGNVEQAKVADIRIDKTAPAMMLNATPDLIKPPNGKMVAVTLSGKATDATSGLALVTYVVTDEYGTPLAIAPRVLTGKTASWTETIELEARRDGSDLDGRLYRIVATLTDLAGNTTQAAVNVVVEHDQRTDQ